MNTKSLLRALFVAIVLGLFASTYACSDSADGDHDHNVDGASDGAGGDSAGG